MGKEIQRLQNIYWSNILLLSSGTQGNHEPQVAYGCGGDCSKGFKKGNYVRFLSDIATNVQDSQEYFNGFGMENRIDVCMGIGWIIFLILYKSY